MPKKRQHEIVQEILETGKGQCILILDGKKLGTLLGELLSLLEKEDGCLNRLENCIGRGKITNVKHYRCASCAATMTENDDE